MANPTPANGFDAAPPTPQPLGGAEDFSGVPLPELPRPGRRGSSGPSVAIPFDPMGYETFQSLHEVKPEPATTKGQLDAARRRANFLPKFLTLESMYAQNPQLTQQGTLRIERIDPHWWQDQNGQQLKVRGLVAYAHPTVGTDEFIRLFGGYKYRVFGMLLQENRENSGGAPQNVDVAVAEFEVPVAPNLENLPVAELSEAQQAAQYQDQPMMPIPMQFPSPYARRSGMPNQQPMGMYYPQPGMMPQQSQQGDGSGLVAPVLRFASDMLGRQQQQSAPNYAPSDSFVNALSQQAQTSQQVIQQSSERQAQLMQSQMERMHQELQEERRRNQEMANRPADVVQMVEGMSKLVSAQKGSADSDLVRQMRDDHERSLRIQREESERQFTRQTADFERAIARANDEKRIQADIYERRINDLEKNLERAQREAREEAERRESMVRNEMQRIMDAREREMQQRVADIKEMHERELRMTVTVQDTTRNTTEQAHAIEMRSMQTDLAKLTAELQQKASIVEAHLAEKNRPLLEQVQELTQLHENLKQIAGPTEDDEDDEKPSEDTKWYNSPLVRDMAKAAVTKGAELLPKLQQAITSQGAAPPEAAAMAQQQAMMAAQQHAQAAGRPVMMSPHRMRPMPRLPQKKRVSMSFADSEAPEFREAAEQAPRPRPMAQPFTQPGNAQIAVPPPPSPLEGGPMPQRQMMRQAPMAPPSPMMPNPTSIPQAPRASAAPPPQVTAQQAMANPGPNPAQAAAWEPFNWMPLGPAEVEMIVTQLNAACEQKVPVPDLVTGLLQSYPMPIVSSIPITIPIDQFVDTIRSAPVTSKIALATGKGRRFLQDLWKEITQRCAALQAEIDKKAETEEPSASDEEAPTAHGEEA